MKYLNLAPWILVICMIAVGPTGAAELNKTIDINPESLQTKEDFENAYQTLKVKVHDLKVRKKAAVTREQKNQVKKEIKEIKQLVKEIRSKPVSGGIYIGSGALILLLILLLIL